MEDTLKLVLCNCPVDRASDIARTLVDEGYVACVNIIPKVQSVYRWEGNVVVDEESTLLMKTIASMYTRLESRLLELHPYDVPEIVEIAVEDGFAGYVSYVAANVGVGN